MRDYLRLQEGKARKKAYKERKRLLKLAAGETTDDRHAHSLSPSSMSSQSLGEIVPSPLLNKDRNVDADKLNKLMLIL